MVQQLKSATLPTRINYIENWKAYLVEQGARKYLNTTQKAIQYFWALLILIYLLLDALWGPLRVILLNMAIVYLPTWQWR